MLLLVNVCCERFFWLLRLLKQKLLILCCYCCSASLLRLLLFLLIFLLLFLQLLNDGDAGFEKLHWHSRFKLLFSHRHWHLQVKAQWNARHSSLSTSFCGQGMEFSFEYSLFFPFCTAHAFAPRVGSSFAFLYGWYWCSCGFFVS